MQTSVYSGDFRRLGLEAAITPRVLLSLLTDR